MPKKIPLAEPQAAESHHHIGGCATLKKSHWNLGAWRSLDSALAWGARGQRFKSARPDFSLYRSDSVVVREFFVRLRVTATSSRGAKIMFQLDLEELTPKQRAMVALWEAHLKAELQEKDAHASCDTMVANPYVNHVAVLTGGLGRRQLENYYSRYFIPGQPPDLEIVPISRTVGQDRIVDEFVYRGTHS